MKNIFSWMVLASIFLSATASAQNYRPFRTATTYQFAETATPGDTIHALKLGSGLRVGNDSVFQFNKRTSAGPNRNSGSCGSYTQRPDNLFGTSMRVRPGAEYVLTAASGRTFTLRPRLPLGQPWIASLAGIVGRVTARTLGTVLGQPDSLATITLSNGAVIMLGKRLGWVSGPALGHYLNAQVPQAALTLTALPELGLGTAQTGSFVVYDFQPGDLFLRQVLSLGAGVPCSRTTAWVRDSIISRRLSANGDTLVYQIRTRTLTTGCGSPTLTAPATQSLRIERNARNVGQLTGYWDGPVNLPAWRTAAFNRRPVQQHLGYSACNSTPADSTGLFNTAALDAGYSTSSAPGLGLVQSLFSSFSSQLMFLVGYRKGTETWGQLTPFAQLLPTSTARAAVTTAAYPNPFGTALTLTFDLTQPQSVALTLHDALGRPVLQLPAAPQPAGTRQLALATAGLPAGLYTLHLRFGHDGHTEVLKVLKTQ